MRELEFLEDEDEISQDIFDMVLRGPYSEPLCPRLLKLSWIADPIFGGDFTSFLSPQLQHIRLESRPGTVFPFSHAISILPASSLKSLRLCILGDEPVREAITSMFKACGESLTTLTVSRMDQLQDGSWCRIMLYPRLRTLETDQFPPTPPNLPMVFPSLRRIVLRGPAAPEWIRFLAASSVQKIPSDTGSKPRQVAPFLVRLCCDYDTLGPQFASHIRVFRNLYTLILRNGCPRQCTFNLTDDDVSQLAMELPGLRELSLGTPCYRSTCWTTVNSLLTLSTHCKGLRGLSIHFNTLNIAQDMRASLQNPLRRNSYPPSRCPLPVLDVGRTPLPALGGDVFPILAGLVDIFPELTGIRFYHSTPGWSQLVEQIPRFQEMRKSLPAVFTQ